MFYLYLNPVHKTASGVESNAVQINVDYKKYLGGINLSILACKHEKGNDPGHFSTVLMGSPSVDHKLEAAGRKPTQKKIDGFYTTAKSQIEAKSGPAWEKVDAFLKEHGMTLEGTTTPAADMRDSAALGLLPLNGSPPPA